MGENFVQGSDIFRRKEIVFTPNDHAYGFCDAMTRKNLPGEMKRWVLGLLHEWGLTDFPSEYSDDIYFDLLMSAKAKLRDGVVKLSAVPGYQDIYEATYLVEEKKQNSLFLNIEEKLGETLTFKLFFFTSDFVVVVLRKDGRRQALRIKKIKRSQEEIETDLKKVPGLFPHFEIITLDPNKDAILIDWVEGRHPETDEEREECLKLAEPLKDLQIQKGTGDWIANLDLNNTNFVITVDHHVYVIDQHLILGLINEGFKET